MRHLILLSAVVAVLALPGVATAGGWATVGIAPLADGIDADETWATEITVLQHGVRPLDGLSPSITISSGGDARTFTASPTGRTGVYEARVVFPEPGSWSVVVESGFGDSRMTYGPVTIGASPVATPNSFPVLPVAVVVATFGLVAAFVLGVRRIRRLSPASR